MSTNQQWSAERVRVLVVDDDEDAAELLAQLLSRDGDLQIATASTGEQALALAAATAPDSVVLDLGLPDMDGYEVHRRLRALPGLSQTIYIALSGRNGSQDRDRVREVGFDQHFVKPPDLQALRLAVRQRRV